MSGFIGNGETTPGGKALKFYSSVRIEVKISEKIKQDNAVIGRKTILTTVKNKVASPFKKALVANIWSEGFSPAIDILNNAVQVDVVKQSGKWYSFDGQKIGNGIFETRDYLKKHYQVLLLIEKEAREKLKETR